MTPRKSIGCLTSASSSVAHRGLIRRIVRGRILRLEVDDDADAVLSLGAIGLHRGSVSAQQVMRGDRCLEAVAMSGGKRAVEIAAVGDNPRLVASYVQPELTLVQDWGAQG